VIDLRVGTSLANSIDRVRWAATEAGNVNVVGIAAHEVLNNYLRWTEDAAGQLGNVLPRSTVTDLLHTPAYWHFRGADGTQPRLIPALLRELDTQKATLEEIAAGLVAAEIRWAGGLGEAYTIAVPDTTMFLNGDAPFEDIDWRQVTNSRPSVRVVVPLAVVDELDRLKRQGNNTTSKLARYSINWLDEHLPFAVDQRTRLATEGIYKTTIEVLVEDTPRRLPDADLSIIASAQQLGTLAGAPTTLVTRDLGMALRARAITQPVVHLRSTGAKPKQRDAAPATGAASM